MVKTFLKLKKFSTLAPNNIKSRRLERKRAYQLKLKKKSRKRNVKITKPNEPISSPVNPFQYDILSRYSKDRIDFLFHVGDNFINENLSKEKEEFCSPFPIEETNLSINIKRNCILYGLHDLLYKISTGFNFIFPENFEPSVMALFDYFLSKSHKEMKASYMGRILYACLDIIDKEEGLGVFLNEDFQINFTTDDEIDVLEATDFTIYPIKPFDYFSHFCFNAQVIKRGNSNFLNYLKKLKEKYHEISFNFLINEETKINKPSTNYCSILSMAYDATKNNLPTGDNFIIDYMNNFKNKIQYSNDDYILALKQYEDSIHLIEEAKQKYKHISEGNN